MSRARWAPWIASAALVLASGSARAANPACASLPGPIVYIAGPSSLDVVIRHVAATLYALHDAEAGVDPGITVVYQKYPSCLAVGAIVNGSKTAPDPTNPTDRSATYWPAGDQSPATCDLPADLDDAGVVLDEVVPDVGISDVFATTCGGFPNGIGSTHDFHGPIQTMVFIAPSTSQATSISAEAAYLVFGFGAVKPQVVSPWTDPSFIFVRDQNSGTQQMFSTAIGVPADAFKGTFISSTSVLASSVATSADPDKTIGIANVDLADEERGTLKILAYQHFGQTCGYYPDSTATKIDKRNVRDGHYPIWGPIHLFSKVDANDEPINPSAKKLVHLILGTEELPGLDPIALEAAPPSHLIPSCAMRVSRTDEVGPLASFSPPQSCGCFYESLTGGAANCKKCVTSATCTKETPNCHFGYCEP